MASTSHRELWFKAVVDPGDADLDSTNRRAKLENAVDLGLRDWAQLGKVHGVHLVGHGPAREATDLGSGTAILVIHSMVDLAEGTEEDMELHGRIEAAVQTALLDVDGIATVYWGKTDLVAVLDHVEILEDNDDPGVSVEDDGRRSDGSDV